MLAEVGRHAGRTIRRDQASGDVRLLRQLDAPLDLAHAAELERLEARAVPYPVRRKLVRRHAGLDLGAVGLARVAAGKPGRGRARMIAAAVAERLRVVLRKAGEYVERIAHLGEWLHG